MPFTCDKKPIIQAMIYTLNVIYHRTKAPINFTYPSKDNNADMNESSHMNESSQPKPQNPDQHLSSKQAQ